jgi:7,8-dihydropterin-6-yl-methyl-4-(beta-D-ribofuranosyl)aminobenzene 5'-phosphate synthase
MRYFDGAEPAPLASGSPWPGANFEPIDAQTEVAPGVFLVPTISRNPGTLEMRELTLALKTPHGLALVVGCSHSGIEEILRASSSIDPRVHLVIGGLHLVKAPNDEIDRLAHALHDEWKLDRIAPGHCTGEPAFAKLAEVFGQAYQYAGVGSIVELT